MDSAEILGREYPSPYPLPLGEGFSGAALRLAGVAGALLGWPPDAFWNATPAELAAVIGALAGEAPEGLSADDFERLRDMFPDT